MTSQERRFRFTRRRMLMQAAVASGVSQLFKMTEGSASAQEAGAGRGGANLGMGMGGGRGSQPVHYGPMNGPVNKLSAPSGLRVTDMRAVTIASNYDYNIIRLDTNQGVYGLGEVRDGGSKNTVLGRLQAVDRQPGGGRNSPGPGDCRAARRMQADRRLR